jgi:hypothetical protein
VRPHILGFIAADAAVHPLEADMTKKDQLEATVFAAILFVGLPLSIVVSRMLAG